jgi:hypothetical protein
MFIYILLRAHQMTKYPCNCESVHNGEVDGINYTAKQIFIFVISFQNLCEIWRLAETGILITKMVLIKL